MMHLKLYDASWDRNHHHLLRQQMSRHMMQVRNDDFFCSGFYMRLGFFFVGKDSC